MKRLMNSLKLHDQDSFLDYRKEQEQLHREKTDSNDPFSSILTIEINTTELCNRSCVFCPRSDPQVYPNRNLHMTQMGAMYIADHLAEINYKGKISFSGYSENLLNPEFIDIVNTFRRHLLDATLECNTNGDKLDEQYVERLFDAGLDFLYINLYDGLHQIEHFDEVMRNIDKEKYSYRAHSDLDHGLILNNRGGNITWLGDDEKEVEELKGTPCFYPFYKMFIDWNGDVLFCSNDWGKERVVGNIIQQPIGEVWFSKEMTKIRKKLSAGDRSASPCNKCNVKGTLFGKQSFDLINEL